MDQNAMIIDVNNFFTKNQAKYDVFINFKEKLLNLSHDTFNDLINYVQSNKEIIFKDHKNALFFYFNVALESEYNFKTFELYLDVCIYFQENIKKAGLTENEMLIILYRFYSAINYLFSKKFFSIESIVDISFQNDYIFINFMPEIEEYDLEYAQKREIRLLEEGMTSDQDLRFYEFVKNNRQAHFLNRSQNYHPSQLHKFIRDDDVESLQLYLSKNNADVNSKIEFSYYERSQTIENQLSLIKIAATYGSINVFKYLWLQDDVYIDDDLLLYAYFGKNLDIIHFCEQKCKNDKATRQAILTNKNDLLDYYLDNFKDEIIENNEQVLNQLKNFNEDDNNRFKKLTYDDICSSLFSFNFDIVQSCLPKIVYLNRNVEMDMDSDEMYSLNNARYEMDLFEFLYKYKDEKNNNSNNLRNLFYILTNCLDYGANDAFKFCFKKYCDNDYNIDYFLIESFSKNHDLTNYIIDLKISINDIDSFANDIDCFSHGIKYYNEDAVVKLFHFCSSKLNEKKIRRIANLMTYNLSNKMICNLFNRISSLPKKLLNNFASYFLETGNDSICDHIKNLY